MTGNGHPQYSHAPQPHSYYSRSADEISLYELWDVLCRRWPVIAVSFLVVVTAGLAYALLSPVTYDYRTSIEIGQIYSMDPVVPYRVLESPETTEARLEDEIIPGVLRAYDSSSTDTEIKVKVSVPKNQNRVVLTSTAEESGGSAVKERHVAIVEALLGVHQQEYEEQLTVALNSYPALEDLYIAQLQSLEEELDLSALTAASNEVESEFLKMIHANRATDLRRDALEMRVRLAEVRGSAQTIEQGSHLSSVEYLASRSNAPSSAGTPLILALTIVLGGMLGIFAAFFTEFVSNARQRQQHT